MEPGAEFEESNAYYRVVIESGISDSEFRSGHLAAGRIYCCGGPNEQDNFLAFFVPSVVDAKPGDVVEGWGRLLTRTA